MIIKNQEFDSKFQQNLHILTINKKNPIQQKGSYTLKNIGEPISDIDIQQYVYFNKTLISIICNMLLGRLNNIECPFIFIRLAVGRYKGFELPWVIDEVGSCDYNPEKVKEWYINFSNKKMVPNEILDKIYERLFMNDINIYDLLKVEDMIEPYAEIVWNVADICRGFVIKDNIRYFLLNEMKTETPVLEFLYKYENNYISIDLGLVDRNYTVKPKDKMYKYYTLSYYKILKSYRWKVYPDYRNQLLLDTNKVGKLLALVNEIDMLSRMKSCIDTKIVNDVTQIILFDLKKNGYNYANVNNIFYLEKIIRTEIDNQLSMYVWEYIDKLQEIYKLDAINSLKRGIIAQISVSQKELSERYSVGIKCPFFTEMNVEIDILEDLSRRSNIQMYKLVDCCIEVSKERNITFNKVLSIFGKNNYHIEYTDDKFVYLHKGNIIIGKYRDNNILKIIRIILFYND